MSTSEKLRGLPSVDGVLKHPEVVALRQRHSHLVVADWTRQAIERSRRLLLSGNPADKESLLSEIVKEIHRSAVHDLGQSVQRVINATGIILHTNLGRAPLAVHAIDRMNQAAGYASVELDLATGRRGGRGQRATKLLAKLCDAEAALVVNNCAAATMLVLQTIAVGREVIVSRGQLVEIGGGFRLPDVFRAAGVVLREVGTTNRTYLRDYETAINEQTAAIIRVHRSNFFLGGFVAEPTIEELVSIPRPNELPVVDDLGSGCIRDLSEYGIDEPTVIESVASGADLTLFSGDKLFGGPQAGIIVGRSHWIDKLRRSPLMRAMRVDKVTLAGLEATTEIHLAGRATEDIPALSMLATNIDQIRGRCDRVVAAIAGKCQVEIMPCESQLGGGTAAGKNLPSCGVRIVTAEIDLFASRLRAAEVAVQGRVADGSLCLDLRTVADHEVESLIATLMDAFESSDRST